MLRPDGTVKVLDFGLAKAGARRAAGAGIRTCPASPTMTYAGDGGRRGARHGGLHEPRAGARPRGGQALGHLVVRLRAVRVPDGAPGVPRRDGVGHDRRDPQERADLGALPRGHAAARARAARALPLQGPARSPARHRRGARDSGGRSAGRCAGRGRRAAGARRGAGACPLWAAASPRSPSRSSPRAPLLAYIPKPARRLRSANSTCWRRDRDGLVLHTEAVARRPPHRLHREEPLWVRDLDQLEPRAVADVGGLTPLAWSPDSRTVVYNDRKQLWKVAVDGGAPVSRSARCPARAASSAPRGRRPGSSRSRSGAAACTRCRWAEARRRCCSTSIPPRPSTTTRRRGSRTGTCSTSSTGRTRERAGSERRLSLAVFDGSRGFPIAGDFGGSNPSPVVTASGTLLFVRRDANAGIWAVPYDAPGAARRASRAWSRPARRSVSVADDGSLLYMEGQSSEGPNELVWVDRAGKRRSRPSVHRIPGSQTLRFRRTAGALRSRPAAAGNGDVLGARPGPRASTRGSRSAKPTKSCPSGSARPACPTWRPIRPAPGSSP